ATAPVAVPSAEENAGTASPEPDLSAPLTLERLQESWRPGEPIPVWWPPAREANPKRLSRQQLARLHTQGAAVGLTDETLARYCHLLFHRGPDDLAHWQAAILLARLDPRFPS